MYIQVPIAVNPTNPTRPRNITLAPKKTDNTIKATKITPDAISKFLFIGSLLKTNVLIVTDTEGHQNRFI
jgi:hypothetical protein